MIPITINRWSGLGDVCMAMCAAKSLNAHGYRVTLMTDPQFHDLARACPNIHAVVDSSPDAVDLNDCQFGLSHLHEVDAFLEKLGITEVRTSAKSLDLQIPNVTEDGAISGSGWIALHPSTGDLNRSWPLHFWVNLARRLEDDGHQVLAIGSDLDASGKGAMRIPGIPSFFNLPYLELVALLNRCAVLVSCDSGPIQLAGATSCAIVGIYSVVSGEVRLPYRSWGRSVAVPCYCPHFPCYSKINVPSVWAKHGQPLRDAGVGLGKIFGDWCLLSDTVESHACIKGLSVQTVHAAIRGVLA